MTDSPATAFGMDLAARAWAAAAARTAAGDLDADRRETLSDATFEAEVYVACDAVRFKFRHRDRKIADAASLLDRLGEVERAHALSREVRSAPASDGTFDVIVNGPSGYVARLKEDALLVAHASCAEPLGRRLLSLYAAHRRAPGIR